MMKSGRLYMDHEDKTERGEEDKYDSPSRSGNATHPGGQHARDGVILVDEDGNVHDEQDNNGKEYNDYFHRSGVQPGGQLVHHEAQEQMFGAPPPSSPDQYFMHIPMLPGMNGNMPMHLPFQRGVSPIRPEGLSGLPDQHTNQPSDNMLYRALGFKGAGENGDPYNAQSYYGPMKPFNESIGEVDLMGVHQMQSGTHMISRFQPAMRNPVEHPVDTMSISNRRRGRPRKNPSSLTRSDLESISLQSATNDFKRLRKRSKGRGTAIDKKRRGESDRSNYHERETRSSKRLRNLIPSGSRIEDGFVERSFREGPHGGRNTVYVSATIKHRNFKGVMFDTTGLEEGDGTSLDQLCRAHIVRLDRDGDEGWVINPGRASTYSITGATRSATTRSRNRNPAQLSVKSAFANASLRKNDDEFHTDYGSLEHNLKQAIALPENKRPHVVVVGAGLSGLSCARSLLSIGCEVTVLEASDRVGGRCLSRNFGDSSMVDLGAGWIHGISRNPLTSLARDNAIELLSAGSGELMPLYDCSGKLVSRENDDAMEECFNNALNFAANQGQCEAILFEIFSEHGDIIESISHKADINDTNRPRIPRYGILENQIFLDAVTKAGIVSKGIVKEVALHLEALTAAVELASLGHDKPYCSSLGEALTEYWDKTDEYREYQSEERRVFQWHISNLEYANATNLDKLSMRYWNEDDPFTYKGPHCMLKGGFGRLLDCMGRNVMYSGGTVNLKHKVCKVSMLSNGDQPSVVVSGNKSDSEEFVIEADSVVVTLPLGVLKAQTVLFDPPLPVEKQKAIERLGFGLLNKIVLHFEKCFWDRAAPVIGHVSVEQGNNYMFVNMLPITGLPVLASLVSGRFAESIEHKSDDIVVSETLEVLRGIYRNRPVPPPVDFCVTRWQSNEFSRGSYSFIASGSSPADIGCIAEPIRESIFFAGEATTMTHFASAHGAVLTGIREAARITKILAKRLGVSFVNKP